jgi:hypothetical protein
MDDHELDVIEDLRQENKRLVKAILGVPEFIIYGNWDYKRCLFCGGKREHKENCIRKELEDEKD